MFTNKLFCKYGKLQERGVRDEFFGKVAELMMTENISRHKRKRLIIFITVITLLSTVTTTVAWFSVNTFAGVDNLNFSICASAQLKAGMENYGTDNNDDSTFAITDKVYDRAMLIDINIKGVAFDAPQTDSIYINYKHFENLLNTAKVTFIVLNESMQKLNLLDELFGEENINECKDCLKMLKKLV